MTIKELANISCVSEDTVNKNILSVPGVIKDKEGELIIPSGTRMPYDAHRYTFNSMSKRRDALLMATSKCRYVDHTILHMEKSSFDRMLSELVRVGLLEDNGSPNPYGANRYDTTILYDQMYDDSSRERIQLIDKISGENNSIKQNQLDS